jgi:class 3 adenylate cyclase
MTASTSTSTPRLATWPQVWALSTAISVIVVTLTAVFVYLHHEGEVGRFIALASLGGHAVMAAVGYGLGVLIGTPYARLQRALDAGVAPESLPRPDVIAALRMPTRAFVTIFLFHVAYAIVFSVVGAFVDVMDGLRVDLVVATLALGCINATLQHYGMAALVRARVAPVLLPRGRLDHLVDERGHLPRTMVFEHIAMTVLTFGVAWPVLVLVFLRTGGESAATRTPALVLLVVMFVLLAALQTWGIVRSVSWAVGHLVTRMEEVRAGRLDVQAQVFELDSLGLQASEFNRMVEGLRQRDEMKEMFGRYVTQQVATEILAGRVTFSGELKTATVLFSDIRGFTRMSEQLAPQEVVAFLNGYLTAMVDCVIEHRGVLDKFIGDAVMAVFGVPVGQGDVGADARAAVACAQAMSRRLEDMNAARVAAGQARIEIGIGIHTGELVAGNIGSPRRMQYTVIGDTVNVGARLESLTKEQGRRTLLSEATAAWVREVVDVVEVGRFAVRGRAEPLLVFGLASETGTDRTARHG